MNASSTIADYKYLTFLVLISLIMGVTFYTGFYCSDDTRYFIGIHKIQNGIPIDINSPAERRLLFLLPSALINRAFSSLYTIFLFSITYYVGITLTAYYAGFSLGGMYVARVAGITTAFHPLLYTFSGSLLPDNAVALFLGLSLLCLLLSIDKRVVPKLEITLVSLSGFFIGYSLCIKESALIFTPIPLIWFTVQYLQDKEFTRFFVRSLFFMIGFAAFLLLEMIFQILYAGEAYSTLFGLGSVPDFRGFIKWQGLYPWERFDFLFRELNNFIPWSFVVPFFLVPALLFLKGVEVERQKIILVFVYFAWPLIYYTIGTSSLLEYIPPVIQARYYAPCVLPLALIISLFIVTIGCRDRRLKILSIAIISIYVTQGFVENFRTRGLISAAEAKISFITAVYDTHQRFPNMRFVDTPSKYEDVDRYRKIVFEYPNLSRELLAGNLTYEDVNTIEPPFIIIGHGDLERVSRNGYLDKLYGKITKNDWYIKKIGHYYLKRNYMFTETPSLEMSLDSWMWNDRLYLPENHDAENDDIDGRFHVETFLVTAQGR